MCETLTTRFLVVASSSLTSDVLPVPEAAVMIKSVPWVGFGAFIDSTSLI
ncbi:hypothetical protein [Moraxella lacunata]